MTMSQNVPLSKQTLTRLPTIKNGLILGWNHDEIGEKCGVTEKTIDRDISAWINSGLFEQWIKEEFLRLHPIMVKSYPDLVYRELARLIGRMVTQKREITEQVEVSEHVKVDMNVLTDEDKSILDRAARLLEQKGARRLSDLH